MHWLRYNSKDTLDVEARVSSVSELGYSNFSRLELPSSRFELVCIEWPVTTPPTVSTLPHEVNEPLSRRESNSTWKHTVVCLSPFGSTKASIAIGNPDVARTRAVWVHARGWTRSARVRP